MVVFHKSIGDFDRIELDADGDWAVLTMRVGYDAETIRMTFRSDDAMRDLQYVVNEYVRKLDERDAA